jgi:hypothetical protein
MIEMCKNNVPPVVRKPTTKHISEQQKVQWCVCCDALFCKRNTPDVEVTTAEKGGSVDWGEVVWECFECNPPAHCQTSSRKQT